MNVQVTVPELHKLHYYEITLNFIKLKHKIEKSVQLTIISVLKLVPYAHLGTG